MTKATTTFLTNGIDLSKGVYRNVAMSELATNTRSAKSWRGGPTVPVPSLRFRV